MCNPHSLLKKALLASHLLRRATPDQLPLAQHDAIRRIPHGLEPMRDRNDRTTRQLLAENLLDPHTRLEIDTRRRLVENHNGAPPQQRPREANELPLALGQVLAARVDDGVEGPAVPAGDLGEDGGAGGVAVFGQRVEIHAHGAGEEDGVLG